MTSLIKRYWKWDEKLNNTPYKLGSDINDLLRRGLVCPNTDNTNKFLGRAKGAPKYVEATAGKLTLVWFSFLNDSSFPNIAEGLWDMEEYEFIATLDKFMDSSCEPEFGDNLFVAFRGGFVTAAAIFRAPN